MPVGRRSGFGTGDGDHPGPMRHVSDAVMDPLASALDHGLADAVHTNVAVVIATNRENGCELTHLANQVSQVTQLGRTIHQVTPQQDHIGVAAGHGTQYLPAQRVGSAVPEVNVADIQQPTRVVPRRQSFFAHVEGPRPPELQRADRRWRSPARKLRKARAIDQWTAPRGCAFIAHPRRE